MKTYLLLFFLFISGNSFAQTDSVFLRNNIKAGMDSLSHSFEKKDWNSFVHFMHPALIEKFGGEERFVNFLNEQMKTLLAEAELNRMSTGNVLQLVKHNNQWQCVVGSYLQMTIKSTVISTISSNIGVSHDNGLTWKFIRITNNNEAEVKNLFPGISPEIKIPNNKTSFGETIEELLKTYKPEYPPKL